MGYFVSPDFSVVGSDRVSLLSGFFAMLARRMKETGSVLETIGTMIQELEQQQEEDALGKTLDKDLKVYNVSSLRDRAQFLLYTETDLRFPEDEQEATGPMIDQMKEHVNTYLAAHSTVIIETGHESESTPPILADDDPRPDDRA
jgi:hypothetical protein